LIQLVLTSSFKYFKKVFSRNRILKRIWEKSFSEEFRENLDRRITRYSNKHILRRALGRRVNNLQTLTRSCIGCQNRIDQPFVLISQLARSGGSLLSQLLDGHPQLYVLPGDTKLCRNKKFAWPLLDITDNPNKWFGTLFNPQFVNYYMNGYTKGLRNENSFRFLQIPKLQQNIFINHFKNRKPIQQREIFSAFLGSFFSAWLNYQHEYLEKKYYVAFTPMLALDKQNVTNFIKVYPDGKMISVIRDPVSWYASARRHKTASGWFNSVHEAALLWNKSVQAILDNKKKYNDSLLLIRFDNLIHSTENIMRIVSDFMQIKFNESMLNPTFNGQLIKANSSFNVAATGIIKNVTNRSEDISTEIEEEINNLSDGIWKDAISKIDV